VDEMGRLMKARKDHHVEGSCEECGEVGVLVEYAKVCLRYRKMRLYAGSAGPRQWDIETFGIMKISEMSRKVT
jgi:hypothetical protein